MSEGSLSDRADALEGQRTDLVRAGRDAMIREQQLRLQNAVLCALSRSGTLERGDLAAAAREIAEAASAALGVDRVGIWFYNADASCLECFELYQRSEGRHTAGVVLAAADFPAYFRALSEDRSLAADDARTDPRTSEFKDSYLDPLGITSMLDAPVRVGGRVIGVVCHEHVGEARQWSIDEQTFAASMGDFVALAVSAARRADAERSTARHREFLMQVIDLNPNLIFAKDRDGRFTLVNRAVAEMYGTTVEELIGRRDADFNPNADEVAFFRRMDQQVMDTVQEMVIPEEAITDAHGRMHWLQTVKRPIIGADGNADQVLGVSVDITDRKLAEERQMLMVRELDHRVKNNLFAVMALAEQTAATAKSLADFMPAFTGRIRSMAVAHEALAHANWQGAELGDMVERLLEPYRLDNPGVVELSRPSEPVLLPPAIAPALCMMIHELATNAAKYGALSDPGGRVTLGWRPRDGRLRLEWRERGGPPVQEPASGGRGFGTELIERAARHQLRGSATVYFEPEGVRCAIDVPLEPPQRPGAHESPDRHGNA
jgi:PAS domain S-box-containing protein